MNWAGGTSTTTGLSGDNIQSNTAAPEVKATLTTQAVTLTATAGQGVNGNNITIAFTSGGTAGSEVVSVAGTAITVQIASGTSTATQVVTALNLASAATALIVASGSTGTTVSTASALNLAGGTTASGITRSTKLSLDTANSVVINSSTGTMTSEPILAVSRGGTGLQPNFSNQNVGDVLQVNSAKTALTLGALLAIPAALRVTVFNQNY